MTKSLGNGMRDEPGPRFKFVPNTLERAMVQPSEQAAAPAPPSGKRVLRIRVKGEKTAAIVKSVAERFAGKEAVTVR